MALFYNVFHFLYERMAGCETAKMSINKHVKFAHDVNIILGKNKTASYYIGENISEKRRKSNARI